MMKVALTIVSADGLDSEEIELREFSEEEAAAWLIDNCWTTSDGEFDFVGFDTDHFDFIHIKNEAEGLFIFTRPKTRKVR